jgi:hypothetical protein
MCSCGVPNVQYLMKITPDEARKMGIVTATPPNLVEKLFEDLEFEVTMEGRKTSEGDGRTAADIEREMKLAAQETNDGAE